MPQDNVNLYYGRENEYHQRPWNGINHANLLNDITAHIYNSRILDFQQPQNDLLDVIRSKAQKVQCNTEGMYVTHIKDSWGTSVIPGGRNTTLPNGNYSLDIMKIALGIQQYYANAEITAHDMDFEGNGGKTMHNINVVSDSLDQMLNGVKWALTCWAFGNGTGQLGTVVVETGDTAQSSLGIGDVVTIKLGNTYLDLGIDGARFLMTGKRVDIYNSAGTTLLATVEIDYIKRNRIRSDKKDYFKGHIVYVPTSSTYSVASGQNIYGMGWHESGRNPIMQGIRQIVNPVIPGLNAFGVASHQIFENLQRGSEFTNPVHIYRDTDDDAEIFRSQLWRSNKTGTDVGLVDSTNYSSSVAATDEGTFDGSALADWDLGTIREILDSVDFDSKNSGKVDTLFMNPAMANMFFKISKDKIIITETEAQAESTAERGFDVKRAKQFIREDGTVITFHITPWMMNNEILGLCSDDLFFLEGPAAHFLNRNGGTWEPTYANNKDNYQAPYKGFGNFGAYRCDKCFWIQGLKSIND